MKRKNGPEHRFEIRKDIVYRKINGQTLFLMPGMSEIMTLNRTGEYLWSVIRRGDPLLQGVEKYAKHFGIKMAPGTADVRAFLKDLEKRKILRKIKSEK